MLGAAVLVSPAGNLFTFRTQQWPCGKPCCTPELRLNRLAQILHDMKSIGDLPRLRRAFLRALGERTAAIPTDDLDARMPLEPAHSHACVTFREKIEHLPSLQVHDDGSVSGALAPCPIIDAHDPRLPIGAARLHPSFETAQYCVVARRHAEPLDQALSWTPAHAMGEKINDFSRPIGASRSRSCDLGQLRGEGLTIAGSVSTLPALETELHNYGGALRRQILQMALMPAASARRSLSAVWTDTRPDGRRRN